MGPFLPPPLQRFAVSTLDVKLKKISGAKLIMELSRAFERSVNDFISKEDYSMYDADDAIRIMTRLGIGALMAESDLKHALSLVPVGTCDWNLLLYAQDRGFYSAIV